MEIQKEYKVNRYVFFAIILVFGIFLFYSLFQFFTAFLTAIVLYVLTKPFVRWLITKKKWKKSSAAVVVIIISFFILLLPIVTFASILFNKIASLAANPDAIMDAMHTFNSAVKEKIGFELISSETTSSVQTYVTGALTLILNQGLNFFASITMMYFILYFLILHTNRLEASIVFFLPFPRSKIMLFGNELVEQTFSNSVGIPLIAIVQGVFAYIAYLITGLPEAGLWGALTGFASVVPIIGTALIWAPIAIYFVATGNNWQALFLTIWGLAFLGLLDNVVRFILAKKMADVHPIVTVLGVIMGIKYFGLIGLVVGPLLISYFIILLRIYYTEYQVKTKKIRVTENQQPWSKYLKPLIKPKNVVTKQKFT